MPTITLLLVSRRQRRDREIMSKNWLTMLKNTHNADHKSRGNISPSFERVSRLACVLTTIVVITFISLVLPLYNPVEPLILILLMLVFQPIKWFLTTVG